MGEIIIINDYYNDILMKHDINKIDKHSILKEIEDFEYIIHYLLQELFSKMKGTKKREIKLKLKQLIQNSIYFYDEIINYDLSNDNEIINKTLYFFTYNVLKNK